MVPVYNGPGRVYAYVTETIVKGEPLVLAADGKLSKAVGDMVPVVARAAESRTGAGRAWVTLVGV
jgi:hypothetical protein